MRISQTLTVVALLAALPLRGGEPFDEPPFPEEAVNKGLRYLASKQNKDGSFGKINTVAITGMACMAFLASGSTPSRGDYQDHVGKALTYLMSCQEKNGCILQRSNMSWAETHSHGYGLLCLTQAYGMVTEDMREKLGPVITKAIKAAVSSQSDNGGWGYGILQKNFIHGYKDEGSCSVTQLQALRACQDIKFDVPETNVRKAIAYVEKCLHKETGGFIYSLHNRMVGIDTQKGMHVPTYAVSAAMLSTLNSAGAYKSALEAKGLAYLDEFLDGKRKVNIFFFYGNFYAAQAYYQAGPGPYARYRLIMEPQVLKRQRTDGSFPGEGQYESEEQYGSPLLTTAFALLVLQVPNQYLPIFQR